MSGRPKKATAEEKRNVILRYWIVAAECKPERMRNTNIKSKLAAFAQEHGIAPKNGGVFLSTDFKNEDCMRYIDELCASAYDSADSLSAPVFVPMDFDRVLTLSPQKLQEYLQVRDSYYETQHKKVCYAMESYNSLTSQNSEMKRELADLTGKINELTEFISKLKERLERLANDNEYYRRVIKKKVEPMLAERYLNDAPNAYSPNERLEEIINFNIGQAIKEDKHLHVAIRDIKEYF